MAWAARGSWREESYGYRIQRDISQLMSLSESALYHILKRHEQAGLVTAHSVEHAGRLRRMYAITPLGRQRLAEFREEWRQVLKVFDFIERAADTNDEE